MSKKIKKISTLILILIAFIYCNEKKERKIEKKSIKEIQKRDYLSITPKVEDIKELVVETKTKVFGLTVGVPTIISLLIGVAQIYFGG